MSAENVQLTELAGLDQNGPAHARDLPTDRLRNENLENSLFTTTKSTTIKKVRNHMGWWRTILNCQYIVENLIGVERSTR